MPAAAAANTSVPAANAVVTNNVDNPAPLNPRADDTNRAVAVSDPPALVAVNVNDSVIPSAVNNTVADSDSVITADAPPSLPNPFSSNPRTVPPFVGVTVNNA